MRAENGHAEPRSARARPTLRPYQLAAVTAIRGEFAAGRRSTLLVLATGLGKCLGLGTPVLRFDGSLVAVEDVRPGDLLMGPDSRPRRVRGTTRGRGELYRVTPPRGEPWVCNDVHVLTLVHTETSEIVDIDLQSYLAETKHFRHLHKQFTPESGIDFATAEPLPLDPYFLGIWYGDGTKALNGVAISKPDPEIEACVREIAERFGLRVRTETTSANRCPTHHIVHGIGAHRNPLLRLLRSIVGDGLSLPHRYLTASRTDRYEFLAGLLDTDGHMHGSGFEIVQKQRGFSDGICFLARSLGLRAIMTPKDVNGTRYWRVAISGDCSLIPTRIPRKRAPERRQIKCATRTGISVAPIGIGEYAGFELDGDGRFLIGDFTVTHNTVCFSELARIEATHGVRTLVVAPREELVDQAVAKLEALRLRVGVEQARRRSGSEPVVVATPQTLRGARLAKFASDEFGFVVLDEAHRAPASTNRAILGHFADARVLGATATPRRADGKPLSDLFESVAFRMELREGIDGGWLAPIQARRVVVDSVDLSRVQTRAGDLAQDQLADAMETERAIQGVVRPLLELSHHRRTLLFAVDVSHAYALAEALNRIRPGCARAAHGELLPDDRRRLLADFRAGAFQFLVNVQLYTEGFDEPSVECVAIARPTKSLGLYQQIVGRGTRLSPETGKTDLLLLDFTGTAGRHRLIGPADCLAGGGELWPDDVAEEVNRLIGAAARDVQAVLDAAMAACCRRRGELEVDAIVRFHADEIDIFVGQDLNPERRRSLTDRQSGDLARPTDAQRRALERAGVTLSRLPPAFSARDASALLGRLDERRAGGLCSLAQAKAIARGTGIDTKMLTFARASELCAILRMGSWRPQALFGTPEYQAARALRAASAENTDSLRENSVQAAGRLAGAGNALAHGGAARRP